MKISKVWRRAQDIRTESGTAALIASLLQKGSVGLIECGNVVFFSRDVDREVPPAEPGVTLRFRLASAADIPFLVRGGDPSQSSEEMLQDRIERGDLCFIAESPEGELIHSRWVATESGYIPELGMNVLLAPDEAYMYGGYTSPRWRKYGVDGAARTHIFRAMRARGKTRVHSYVRGDSPPALRAAGRWQKRGGSVWYLRIGPFGTWIKSMGNHPTLRKRSRSSREELDRLVRIRQGREWFEGWLQRPAAQRSLGFLSISDDDFEDTARHIDRFLHLDPKKDRVLDVGCASAMVSRRVAPACRQFVGVEMTAGMLADAGSIFSAGGEPAAFAAADGRHLPFPSHAFDKVYSSAVIHMLPGRDDGMQLIEEMLRVCRPGGTVLVASVPDRAKRFNGYADAWRQSNLKGKVRLLSSFLLPRVVKNALRGRLGLELPAPAALAYDVKRIAKRMQDRGFTSHILDFPGTYWSADFQRTRSNLVITIPAEPHRLEQNPVLAKAG
jgi:ubiquinone/menaquinone biosynthesis C-methylase UbiE/ribosomal protein S18 acetylase RimI-like enzyme